MDTFACEPVWMRLNISPIDPSLRYFEDVNVGGLQGCFMYAVRPVGPDGNEGPITRVSSAPLLNSIDNNPGKEIHCAPVGELYKDDTSEESIPIATVLNGPDGINTNAGTHARGTGSPVGSPPAPTSVTRSVQEKPIIGTLIQPTQFATVSWTMPGTVPSDLAGFYVDVAGSPNGPWKRLTKVPVAWWERHYTTQGVGYNRPTGWSGHTDCLSFRVGSVDENGNESAPTVASTPSASTCAGTPDAPAITSVASFPGDPLYMLSPCGTTLTWTRVPGATEYYVYRIISTTINAHFYDTQHLSDPGTDLMQYPTMSYDEMGTDDRIHSPASPDNWCPYSIYYTRYCETGGLDAFYVTARGATGGESPRSNLVFANCTQNPVYAEMSPTEPSTEGIASWENAPGELLMCRAAIQRTKSAREHWWSDTVGCCGNEGPSRRRSAAEQ